MTEIGTSDITPSEWYASIIDTILTGLNLDDDFDIEELWSANSQLSNVKRFSKFIGEILLLSIEENIVIFIDEIDSTLSLPFNIDDFFAVVRDCYNKRADNSDYQRLSFAMIGVATPADLIKEKKRTPFNIGIPIKLTGFRLAEVEPLAKGLVEKTANINKLMEVVLDWTGGQPFLTQKVCKLIRDSPENAPDGQEAEWVADLVRQRIVDNWQVHDDPEHLKTIRDRLLVNEKRASRLLGLYQQVLNSGGVVADDSPEQMELRLTGLVVKQEGRLQVANRIYQEVFNLQWVEKELGNLRPYSEAFNAWEESGCKDESRLLRGQALADALAWAVDKSLSDRDYQFLATAQEVEKQAIELEKLEMQIKLDAHAKANQILDDAKRKANQAKQKAEKQLRISFAVLIPSFMVAVFTGVAVWLGNLKVAEREAVLKSITSRALSNSGKHFEGLLQALRAVKQLPNSNVIFQPQADRKIQITNALSQAIYVEQTYRERNHLQGHEEWVSSVAFSPDGETIASASSDKTVKLWNLQGQLLQTLTGHENNVEDVEFSPDGETIASASSDKTVKLWNLQGQLLQTLEGHENSVQSVEFSPDGETIASAASGISDNTVKLWSRDGKLLQTFTSHEDFVSDVAFSPDGNTIATASRDKTVKLWSRNNQLLSLTEHEDRVFDVAFSPDGNTIATASRDKTVKLWSRDGKLLQTITGHKDLVWSVAFSPDGKTIATASDDKTVKLWSLHGQLLQTLTVHEDSVDHEDYVSSVEFSPDGNIIATASNYTVKLWHRNGELLQTLTHEDFVSDLAFTPDGNIIATASDDKTVKLWNLQGQLLHTTNHEDYVSSVEFSPDGNIIATASNYTVKLWSRDGKLLHTLISHEENVVDVVFSPDGEIIATASYDKTVKLWNLQGKLLQTLTGHESFVWDVEFSPDGETIASASLDKTVKLWRKFDGFDPLHEWACNWMRDYLENNPNVSESDRHLCDGVGF